MDSEGRIELILWGALFCFASLAVTAPLWVPAETLRQISVASPPPEEVGLKPILAITIPLVLLFAFIGLFFQALRKPEQMEEKDAPGR